MSVDGLQHGGVVAFAGSIGVAWTFAGHQTVEGLELLAAVLAGVAAFLATFIGLVETFTRAKGMAGASGVGQRINAWKR